MFCYFGNYDLGWNVSNCYILLYGSLVLFLVSIRLFILGIMYRNMFVLIDRLKKIYVDKEIIV